MNTEDTAMTSDELLVAMSHAVRHQRPVVYVTAHPHLLERRKRELLQLTGGFLNVRWYTWNQWVDHLLLEHGKAYLRMTQSVRQDIVESLLHHLQSLGKIPQLAKGLHHPGMSQSIALWMEDLTKDSGEKWESIRSTLTDELLQELDTVAYAYFQWTAGETTPFKEAMQQEQIACQFLRMAGSHSLEGADLFFEGALGKTEQERQLLATLQSLYPNIDLHDVSSPLPLKVPAVPTQWYSLSSDQAEVRVAVQHIRRTLQNGGSLSDVAVVVPNEEYRQLLSRELRLHQLVERHPRTVSLLHQELVQRLLHLLQLKTSNWSREAVLQASHHPQVMGDIPRHMMVWGRDVIRQSGVVEGEEAWKTLFRASWGRGKRRLAFLQEGDEQESLKESATIQQRLEAARHWLRMLRRLSRMVHELPDEGTWGDFVQVTQTWIPSKRQEDTSVGEALRQVLRMREDIAKSFDPHQSVTLPLQRFYHWFLEKARSTIVEKPGLEGVLVCLPDEIRGGRFAFLHVLGLAEEVLPAVYAPHWIWERCGQADRASHQRDECVRLQEVLNTVTQELFCSTPRTAGRGQPVVPNRAFMNLLGEPEIGAEESRSARKPALRLQEQQGVGWFSDEESLHVTGVESYRRCAFRFFADRLLGVRDRVERTDGLTPQDVGSLLHKVLKKWGEEGRASSEDPLAIATRLLAGELDELEQRYQLSGTLWRSQRERVQQDFIRFVEQEAELLGRSGLEAACEWGFGLVLQEKMAATSTSEPLLLQQGDRTLRLCGIVDRVDVGTNGFSVHDYKLSRCPSRADLEAGEDFQMGLYLLAYQRWSASEPLRGRYALLREPGGGQDISFGEADLAFAHFAERLEKRVFEVVDRMISGDVSPSPWKPSECLHCSYQFVCRQREHLERSRVSG